MRTRSCTWTTTKWLWVRLSHSLFATLEPVAVNYVCVCLAVVVGSSIMPIMGVCSKLKTFLHLCLLPSSLSRQPLEMKRLSLSHSHWTSQKSRNSSRWVNRETPKDERTKWEERRGVGLMHLYDINVGWSRLINICTGDSYFSPAWTTHNFSAQISLIIIIFLDPFEMGEWCTWKPTTDCSWNRRRLLRWASSRRTYRWACLVGVVFGWTLTPALWPLAELSGETIEVVPVTQSSYMQVHKFSFAL